MQRKRLEKKRREHIRQNQLMRAQGRTCKITSPLGVSLKRSKKRCGSDEYQKRGDEKNLESGLPKTTVTFAKGGGSILTRNDMEKKVPPGRRKKKGGEDLLNRKIVKLKVYQRPTKRVGEKNKP